MLVQGIALGRSGAGWDASTAAGATQLPLGLAAQS